MCDLAHGSAASSGPRAGLRAASASALGGGASAPLCRAAAAQAATARESRCAPTLRLTRCNALSTVFVSQLRRSPTCS